MDEIKFSERELRHLELLRDQKWFQEYMAKWENMTVAEAAYEAAEDLCDRLGSLIASDWKPRTDQEWEDFWDMLMRARVGINAIRGVLNVKLHFEKHPPVLD